VALRATWHSVRNVRLHRYVLTKSTGVFETGTFEIDI
jgi:hypothetical protein